MELQEILHHLVYAMKEYNIDPKDIKIVGKDRESDLKLQGMIKDKFRDATAYTFREKPSTTKFCDMQIGEYQIEVFNDYPTRELVTTRQESHQASVPADAPKQR